MAFTALGFDLDGVLVNSRAAVFQAARRIPGVLGMPATVDSMRDYRNTFNLIERLHAPEQASSDSLRVVHRLALRARAGGIPIFGEVVGLLQRAAVPVSIISSALRGTVLTTLAGRRPEHVEVLAHEDGLKEQNLARWSAGQRAIYITDNIKDIAHCKHCHVAVIAVGWGFDDARDLLDAGPDWFARTPADLEQLLLTLELIGESHD